MKRHLLELERIASRNARKEEEARLKPILEAEEAWQAAYKQRWAKIAFEEKLKLEEAQFEDERIKQEAIDVEREHLGYGIELNGQKYKIKAFANLEGANLIGANLIGANLSGANLSGANLSGAKMSKANLSGANLWGTNLSGTSLKDAKLSKANLSGANLSDAKMSKANLSDANLSYANLSGANLEGANLHRAFLQEANLKGANLSGANLLGARLEGANLDGITIQDGTTSDIPKENMLLKTQSFQLQDSDQYMKSTFDGEGTRKARFFICEGIDFSHNPSAPFSLKNEMNNVGYRDIGDFFQQIVKVVENPTALVDLSKRIAHISNKDSFQLVVARLLQSVSFNSEIVKDADINNWVVAADLAGLGMNSQRRLSESLFKIARSVVTNSIRTHGLSGLEIVRKIEIGAVAWDQVSDGKTVFGDDSEAARLLLVGVVLQSILHCLKSAQSSQHVIESLSGSKGQNLSLREEARLMTEIGRQYARANGIDYDDFVRRHFGIHE